MKSELLPSPLAKVLFETPELKQAYLVGGCVRDWQLGIPIHDYDVEVFGLNYEQLAQALARWGRTDLVGRSFGVVKLTLAEGDTYDFSIPRLDSKVAPGHKGFAIRFEPALTPREAAARRDYTMNALMYDPRQEQLLDFFGGIDDLKNRVLRHTSAAFPDDPLRVLRGMQFAARFNLKPAPETVALCRTIKATYPELAVERVREEWMKWAARSTVPSAGLRWLLATEWLEHFPELQAIHGIPQDPEWHPEGDVFIHTGHCCDALVPLPEWQEADQETRQVYMFAILTHDLGKAQTTHSALKGGRMRIMSPGHEEMSGQLAEQFLNRINVPRAIQERVLPLVVYHMIHLHPVTDRAVRRLAKRLEPENIQGLCAIITADHNGRPPKPAGVPRTVRALLSKAAELQVQSQAPQPILKGRHLLAQGLKPGKAFQPILAAAYEAQLEGQFADLEGALTWLGGGNKLR